MVDIAPLHQHHLLQHLLPCDGMTYSRVGFMAVHAFQLHGLPVHIEVATCQAEFILAGRSIFYLNRPESEVGTGAIQEPSLLILQLCHKDVSVRSLSTPQSNTFQFLTGSNWLSLSFNFIRIQTDGVIVELCGKPLGFLFPIILYFSLNIKTRLAIQFPSPRRGVRGEAGAGVRGEGLCPHHQVANFHLRHSSQIRTSEDTGQAEHILGLQERAVAAAINFHRQHIIAFLI